MLKTKCILLNIRLNDLVHNVHGRPYSSQVHSNIETQLRLLPPHPPTVTLTKLSVVPLFSSAHQQPHINARAINRLRLPRHRSQQPCSNNPLDYRLERKQPSLMSSAYRVNELPVPHSSNVRQQMCRILPPPPPTRIINWLLILTRNWMISRPSCLVLRQQQMRTYNA